jgi:hypothetical protein
LQDDAGFRPPPAYGSGGGAPGSAVSGEPSTAAASVDAQPRRRRCLARRRLACLPPSGRRSPRSRYSRPRTGRSAPTVAAETGAVWPPRRTAGPVVVVAPVVGGTALVVVASVVVVGWTVVVGAVAVVLGSTVVVGAVTIGWLVVAPNVDGALVVVVPPAVAGAAAVAGPVVGPLPASGTVSGVVDREGKVVGTRGAVVVVDAEVGAGSAGKLGSALPGARGGGGGWWGTRAAEATRAARTAAVRPKVKNSRRHGRRGVARCRGRRIGMVASSRFDSFFRLMGCPGNASPTVDRRRSCAQQVERCVHGCRCGSEVAREGAGSCGLPSSGGAGSPCGHSRGRSTGRNQAEPLVTSRIRRPTWPARTALGRPRRTVRSPLLTAGCRFESCQGYPKPPAQTPSNPCLARAALVVMPNGSKLLMSS